MPRDKRLHIIGGIYHVYTRGIERKAIFKDDKDKEEFLSRLSDALDKTKSSCYAWALMPNHIHLMVRTGKGSLSDIARRLFTGYAIYSPSPDTPRLAAGRKADTPRYSASEE